MEMRESSGGGMRAASSSRETSASAGGPAIRPGTRCECRAGREPFHACGLALGQGDARCRRETTTLVSTGSNPITDIGFCEPCAQFHEAKAGAR
jgi:hypothetical protein